MSLQLNHLFKDLISKYSLILREWGRGLGLQPMNLTSHNSAHKKNKILKSRLDWLSEGVYNF